MRYVVLDEDAFQEEYKKAFKPVALATDTERERFRDEVFEVQGTVVEALKEKWKEVTDFEVAWDFDYCYHACGGIYSERTFTQDYVETIARALKAVDSEGRWTYHTVCEIEVNPAGRTAAEIMEDRGEFFVRGDVCYVSRSMLPEHRLRLGCTE